MYGEIDESARERDLEIKLGFGSWILFVWAIPISYAVIWVGLLTITTLSRGLMLLLARALDGITLHGLAKAPDDMARFIGRTPACLSPLLIFAAIAAAFWLRSLYRQRIIRSA